MKKKKKKKKKKKARDIELKIVPKLEIFSTKWYHGCRYSADDGIIVRNIQPKKVLRRKIICYRWQSGGKCFAQMISCREVISLYHG